MGAVFYTHSCAEKESILLSFVTWLDGKTCISSAPIVFPFFPRSVSLLSRDVEAFYLQNTPPPPTPESVYHQSHPFSCHVACKHPPDCVYMVGSLSKSLRGMRENAIARPFMGLFPELGFVIRIESVCEYTHDDVLRTSISCIQLAFHLIFVKLSLKMRGFLFTGVQVPN